MAYTNNIDTNLPADTDLVSDGDDAIRRQVADMVERLLTVFKDMDVDPLEFLDGVIKTAAIDNDAITAPKIAPVLQLRSIIRKTVLISDTIASGVIGGGAKSVPGAEPGDSVLLSWANGDGRWVLNGAVTAVDEVTVAYGNNTAGSLTITDQPLIINVIKGLLLETDPL